MAAKKQPVTSSSPKRRRAPASTPEGRVNQLIAAATDLAEERILNGTASNQLLIHFLKQGTTREKIEKEILEKQKELITAKTENLQSQNKIEELYADAIKAMSVYQGRKLQEEEDDYD